MPLQTPGNARMGMTGGLIGLRESPVNGGL